MDNRWQVHNDYSLASRWSTATSLQYHRDRIDWGVNQLPRMVQNDTKLSQAVHNDVKLPLRFLERHKLSKNGRSFLPFS